MQTVIMYGSEWCNYCIQLKLWLYKNNISFTYKDINNETFAKEFNEYNAKVIPLVIIKNVKHNSIIIEGFNPLEIGRLIKNI